MWIKTTKKKRQHFFPAYFGEVTTICSDQGSNKHLAATSSTSINEKSRILLVPHQFKSIWLMLNQSNVVFKWFYPIIITKILKTGCFPNQHQKILEVYGLGPGLYQLSPLVEVFNSLRWDLKAKSDQRQKIGNSARFCRDLMVMWWTGSWGCNQCNGISWDGIYF